MVYRELLSDNLWAQTCYKLASMSQLFYSVYAFEFFRFLI
jgi:hypothetical protein